MIDLRGRGAREISSLVRAAELAPRGSARAALALVEKWMAEDGYDAEVWPEIQRIIEDERATVGSRGVIRESPLRCDR